MDQTQKLNAPIRKHIFLIVAGVLLLLLAAAAGFDWQISQTIGDMNDPFATLFQDVGLWTAPLIIMLSCNIVCHYAIRSQQLAWYTRTLMVIGSVIYAGWELWAGYLKYAMTMVITSLNDINAGKPMGMANSDGSKLTLPGATSIILFLILYLVVFIGSQYWLAQKTDEQLHYLLKMAVVATLVCLLSDQIVNAMKTFWGRFRPYELNGNPTHFTSWFQPNGANGHMSFPSGHTQTAATLLTWFVDRDKPKRQRLVFWLTFAYGAVMAYTRVRILAHFTGDVTMSLILTWSLILILAAVVQQPLVDWEALTARSSAKNLNTEPIS